MKNLIEFISDNPMIIHFSIALFLGILIFQFITAISFNGDANVIFSKVLETLVTIILPLMVFEAVVLYIISNIWLK